MSLATFKRKTINSRASATKRSGKPANEYWVPQGPFGRPGSTNSLILENNVASPGMSGFSLNGSRRSNTTGRTMLFSQQGTQFRGIYPRGNGGTLGKYASGPDYVLLNVPDTKADVRGNQRKFAKPSVLSSNGMLHRRYRWIHSGQYPNNWVQPNYTGNQTDTSSSGTYTQHKTVSNMCVFDVNDVAKYENYFKRCGPMNCKTTSGGGYTMAMNQSNALYTKTLYTPLDSSTQSQRLQVQCRNQIGEQKPFPYRVQTGTGILTGGITVSNVGRACNISSTMVPPAWYRS